MTHKNKKWVSSKIRKIMHEGKAKPKQAVAIAFSMGRAMHKKPRKRK